MRTPRRLLSAVLCLTLLISVSVPQSAFAFSRVGSIPLTSFTWMKASARDATGTFGYFVAPYGIVKVRLSDTSIVDIRLWPSTINISKRVFDELLSGTMTLNIDSAGQFGYMTADDQLVKIRLSDLTVVQVGNLPRPPVLSGGIPFASFFVIDSQNQFGWIGNTRVEVTKVDLNTFQAVSRYPLSLTSDGTIESGVLDKDQGILYAATNGHGGTNPISAQVLKIRTSDMSLLSRCRFNNTYNQGGPVALDPSGSTVYVNCLVEIVKIRTSDMTVQSRFPQTTTGYRVAGLATVDSQGQYLYFATPTDGVTTKILKIRLDNFTVNSSFTFDAKEGRSVFGFLNPNGTDLTVTFDYTDPARIVRLGTPALTRLQTTLVTALKNIKTSAVDATGTFGYFATAGAVMKFRLSDFSRVATVDLPSDAEDALCISVDPQNNYLLVGTENQILKMRLPDLSVQTIYRLPLLEGVRAGTGVRTFSINIDAPRNVAYLGTQYGHYEVLKVNLSDFSILKKYRLSSTTEGSSLRSGAIDTSGEFGYFVTDGLKFSIMKIRLSDFAVVSRLSLPDRITHGDGLALSPDGASLYALTNKDLLRIRLSDFTIVGRMTPSGVLYGLSNLIVDFSRGFIYAADANLGAQPNKIYRFALNKFTLDSSVPLAAEEWRKMAVLFDRVGQFLYCGMDSDPGKIVKVELSGGGQPTNSSPVVSVTAPTNNTVFQAGSNVDVTATASDSDGTVTKVDFYRGTTLIGTDTTSPYGVTWTNATAGSFALTAKATDDKGAATTSAIVNIIVNTPPNTTITAPANNSVFVPGANLTISANASDTDGTISKVEFFEGSNLLGTDTSSPYSFVWNNLPAGAHVLTVKATDNRNGVTTSAAVNITVSNPIPSLLGLSPGSKLAGSQQFTLTVNGSNFVSNSVVRWNGSDRVTTFVSGTRLTALIPATDINTAGNATITVFNPTPMGGTSASQTFDITATPNEAPTVSITNPTDNEVFFPGANISIDANAADTDGTISKVEFFHGTTKIGEDSSSPYSFNWTNVPSGSFVLTAKATDDLGAVTTSDVVSITINALPTVTLTGPIDNAQFNEGDDIALAATATDSDGNITHVEFYRGSTLLGTDNSSPYSFTWQNVDAGNYVLTAKSFDNDGASQTSVQINISVILVTPPTPAPQIAWLATTNAIAGSPSFQLVIDGNNFDSNCIGTWNGQDRNTTFVNPNRIRVQILASDIQTPGTATITVKNGAQTSNAVTFTIVDQPTPTTATVGEQSAGDIDPRLCKGCSGIWFSHSSDIFNARGVKVGQVREGEILNTSDLTSGVYNAPQSGGKFVVVK